MRKEEEEAFSSSSQLGSLACTSARLAFVAVVVVVVVVVDLFVVAGSYFACLWCVPVRRLRIRRAPSGATHIKPGERVRINKNLLATTSVCASVQLLRSSTSLGGRLSLRLRPSCALIVPLWCHFISEKEEDKLLLLLLQWTKHATNSEMSYASVRQQSEAAKIVPSRMRYGRQW